MMGTLRWLLIASAIVLSPRPALAAPSGARLLDAGSEPRQKLRYQCEGYGETFQILWQDRALIMRAVLQGDETSQPTVSLIFRAERKAPARGGCRTWLRIVGGQVAEEGGNQDLTAMYERAVRSLDGALLSVTTSATGELIAFDGPASLTSMPAALVAKLREIMQNELLIPLPREAVGPGARWQVRSPYALTLRSAPVKQAALTRTFTLRDVDRDGFTVNSQMGLEAPDQKIPRHQQRAEDVYLRKLAGLGAGSATHSWSELGPSLAELEYSLELTLRSSGKESSSGYRIVLRSRERIASRVPDASLQTTMEADLEN
jgi:hypothetical protein